MHNNIDRLITAIDRLTDTIGTKRAKPKTDHNVAPTLEAFVREQCHRVPGAATAFADVRDLFYESAGVRYRPRRCAALKAALKAAGFPVGNHRANILACGNLSLDASTLPSGAPYVQEGHRIIRLPL